MFKQNSILVNIYFSFFYILRVKRMLLDLNKDLYFIDIPIILML